jgi:hypothetical protein
LSQRPFFALPSDLLSVSKLMSQQAAGSWFLGLRWLDTALDFPVDALDPIQSSVKPEHFRTP